VASIEEFKGLMSAKGGAARSNLFKVTLPSLPGATSRDVNLLCKDVNLPGRQIMTQERQVGMKSVKVPYGFAVEDVSLTFYVMNDYGIRKYFEIWQGLAVNPATYEVSYKEKYAKDVTISALKKGFSLPIYSTQLGIPKLPPELQNRLPKIGPFDLAQGEFDLDFATKDDEIYQVKLKNAFCTTMNAINLGNELSGITELNIQLSYDDWEGTYFSQGSTLTDTLAASVIGGIAARLF
jgi:hypothetical protein